MKKFSFLFLILLTVFACRKNVDQYTTGMDPDDPTVTEIDYTPEVTEVTASIFGLVVDENDLPVENATIDLDNNVTTTDEKGRFLINDITMNQAGTLVTAKRAGYFTGSHRFFPEEGSSNFAKIMLLDKTIIDNFSGSSGDSIVSSEGIYIYFPANSVVDANGNLHQGNVNVAARWIDPSADNLLEIMPGGLQGISTSGLQPGIDSLEQVALASFGMMAVELFDDSGDLLNLGNNQMATLSFPVPTSMQANAPSQIPLWYFSETYGIWVEEGSATLIDGNYVGEVSHFSYWNCDDPYTLIDLSGTVVTSGGTPVANVEIRLTLLSTGELGGGFTDNNGVFGGKVPMNEALLLEVVADDDVCSSSTIGPFPTNTNIGNIIIDNINSVVVNGTIEDCSFNLVGSAYMKVNIDNVDHHYYFNNNGLFSFALLNCSNVSELTITATNLSGLEQGIPTVYPITSNPLNVGAVSACGTGLPEYIEIIADGDTTTFLNPSLTIGFMDTAFISATTTIASTTYNINFRIEGFTSDGFYSDDKLNDAFLKLNKGNMGDSFSNSCGNLWGGMVCGYDGINVTDFGPVGEEIIGTFSGTADFQIASSGIMTPLSFTAKFKIIRD